MPKNIVVKQDPVRGKDTHKVLGQAANPAAPPPTVVYTGQAKFEYVGSMTERLAEFVTIGGAPVAVVSSGSTLDEGEAATGKHTGAKGTEFTPASPTPIVDTTMNITDQVGPGTPSSGSGSAFVTVNGDAVLLDGDAIDTCDGGGATKNSTVAANGQSFVTVSE